MDVIEAIFTRQSISSVEPDPIPQTLIERLLSSAVQAPNHHRVRPWRFVVLIGDSRRELGEVMARAKMRRDPEITQEALDVERERPMRAPLLIVIGVDKPVDSKIIEIENVCAAAAAAQNILLAAHALGLGAKWRTGPAAYDSEVKQFLGFESDQHVIAFLYIGFLKKDWNPPDRPDYKDRTEWRT